MNKNQPRLPLSTLPSGGIGFTGSAVLLVVGCALSLVLHATAATLTLHVRDSSLVNDTIVHLSDVAWLSNGDDVVTKVGSVVLGETAPAGYYRFINATEILSKITAGFPELGPISCPQKRLKVQTDSRRYSVDNYAPLIEKAIRQELNIQDSSLRITILDTARFITCLNKPAVITVKKKHGGMQAGPVTLDLIATQGSRITSTTVACRISLTTTVVVAARMIQRGEPLSADNCLLVRRVLTNGNLRPCLSFDELTGKRARRVIQQGSMVSSQYAELTPIIEKGDIISLCVSSGSLAISMNCTARESGVMGDEIWVENQQSHTLIKARIAAPGVVVPKAQRGLL